MTSPLLQRYANRDWEGTLQAWIKPASETEDDKRRRTEEAIREAIRESSIPDSLVHVFAKGSYANNTNVRADSDVDIAVEWTGSFWFTQRGDVEHVAPGDLGIVQPAPGP